MEIPNFLVIGVPKAGTTSLWHLLRQHPDIYMPKLKEPRFFVDIPDSSPRHKQVSTLEEYRRLFGGATSEKMLGEASAGYFHNVQNPGEVSELLNNPKLVVMLRNPMERAFSHFLFSKQKGLEPKSTTFRSAIRNKTVSVKDGIRQRPYVEVGFYNRHFVKWRSSFREDKINIILFEDFINNSVESAQEVYDFLGVDSSYRPDDVGRHAKSGIPKSEFLHKLLIEETGYIKKIIKKSTSNEIAEYVRAIAQPIRRWLKNLNLEGKKIPQEEYDELRQTYRKDIIRLSKNVDRNVLDWLGKNMESKHKT